MMVGCSSIETEDTRNSVEGLASQRWWLYTKASVVDAETDLWNPEYKPSTVSGSSLDPGLEVYGNSKPRSRRRPFREQRTPCSCPGPCRAFGLARPRRSQNNNDHRPSPYVLASLAISVARLGLLSRASSSIIDLPRCGFWEQASDMPKAPKAAYYAVRKGREPGIYSTW